MACPNAHLRTLVAVAAVRRVAVPLRHVRWQVPRNVGLKVRWKWAAVSADKC